MPLVADLYEAVLVVGYEDGSVRTWELSKWREGLKAKKLHSSKVSDVKFTQDGSRIITASSDDSIILLDAKTMK